MMKKSCALYLGLAVHLSSFAYSFESWAKIISSLGSVSIFT